MPLVDPGPDPHPLVRLAVEQGGVISRAQALAVWSPAELRRELRSPRWGRIAHDAYAPEVLLRAAAHDPRIRHQLACAAGVAARRRDVVVSHRSAALLHGLPLLQAYDGPPQLTCHRAHASAPSESGLLTSSVPLSHRCTVRGLPTTTRARTVADCARTLPPNAALVLADGALRQGVDRVEVLRVLHEQQGWPGVQEAVDVVVRADPRPESPLESLARAWFHQAGLPPLTPQVEVCRAADGRWVARVDGAWLRHGTVCELDGRVKYDDPLQPGALWREKHREDQLRDLGLEVVRGYWSDGPHGAPLVERVRRAFARAAARTEPAAWGVLSR